MMRKLILIAIVSLFGTITYGQSQTAKAMLAALEGKWELDDNGNVTFVKIVEAPELKKDEIYNRALSYFTYNYGSGKSVIQTQDKEGGLIVGKGLYNDVYVGDLVFTPYIDAWHILRVDVKDGRARVIVTLTQYDKRMDFADRTDSNSSMNISQEYPINLNGGQKTVMMKAFYKSFKKSNETLDRVEKAIKEGNTSKALENKEW